MERFRPEPDPATAQHPKILEKIVLEKTQKLYPAVNLHV
jgi:hypothetical protein